MTLTVKLILLIAALVCLFLDAFKAILGIGTRVNLFSLAWFFIVIAVLLT